MTADVRFWSTGLVYCHNFRIVQCSYRSTCRGDSYNQKIVLVHCLCVAVVAEIKKKLYESYDRILHYEVNKYLFHIEKRSFNIE